MSELNEIKKDVEDLQTSMKILLTELRELRAFQAFVFPKEDERLKEIKDILNFCKKRWEPRPTVVQIVLNGDQ